MRELDAFMEVVTNYRTCSRRNFNSYPYSSSTNQRQIESFKMQSSVGDDEEYGKAGKPLVNMDQYNLDIKTIASQWTAIVTPKSFETEEGIYLNAKDSKQYFVDLLKFRVKRVGGLGLQLYEIAGGRADGVGITIVEEILMEGNADGSGIIAGDSIIALEVVQQVGESSDGSDKDDSDNVMLQTNEEVTTIQTECLGYDATVTALTSLPPPRNDNETILLTVKRIRKKPRITLNLTFPPEQKIPAATIELFAGENLRRAMLAHGVKVNDEQSTRFDTGGSGDWNCGSKGACATCVVSITKGMDLTSPIRNPEKQILVNKPRWRMACRTVVGYGMQEGEINVQINPRRW